MREAPSILSPWVSGQDALSIVGYVGEVAPLAAVAVDDDRLARLDPAAERFHGKIRPLSRPPDGEEPERHEAEAVQAGGRVGRPRPTQTAPEGEMSLAGHVPCCRAAHPGGQVGGPGPSRPTRRGAWSGRRGCTGVGCYWSDFRGNLGRTVSSRFWIGFRGLHGPLIPCWSTALISGSEMRGLGSG